MSMPYLPRHWRTRCRLALVWTAVAARLHPPQICILLAESLLLHRSNAAACSSGPQAWDGACNCGSSPAACRHANAVPGTAAGQCHGKVHSW